jgi:hypothetical protein
MEDLSGLGISASINSESTPQVCNHIGVTANSSFCNRTDCLSYGKWYCPFTGW